MRIAMVSEHASPLAGLGGVDAGGQNVHVSALAHALARRGHEVVVYTRADDDSMPRRVAAGPGVWVEHIKAGPVRALPKDELLPYMDVFAVQLAKRWRSDRPEIVHAHFWMSGVAATKAAATLGRVPVVQTFHALGTVKRRWQGRDDSSPPQRIGLERQLVRTVDHIIATCTDEVGELRAIGAAPTNIDVVPCGVDLELFTAGAAPHRTTTGPRRLLVLGRLVARKGIDDAIRALTGVEDAELLVVGGPPAADLDADHDVARLRAVVAEAGLTDRVHLVGRVPHEELPALIRSCQVVLAVPWYEPFGIVPLEAMACGVPVVATAVGGLLDTVVDGVTGLLVPARAPADVARAVNALLADEDRRVAMGLAGAERVRQRYSWASVAEQTERSYRAVLADRLQVGLTAEVRL